MTPEEAKQHPLWKAFLQFDRKRHCGVPDMIDPHDLEVFEAFVAGYKMGQDDLEAAVLT